MNYGIVRSLLDDADTSLSFCREVSCFITPNQGLLALVTNNSGGAVELPFFKIWEAMKKGERNKYCVMVHTHPPACNGMSGIDSNMVYGWVLALGIPIYFIIVTDEQINCWLCQKNPESKSVIRELIWSFDYCDCPFESKKFLFLKLFSHIMYGLSKTHDEIDPESETELKNNLKTYVVQGAILDECEFNIWGSGK